MSKEAAIIQRRIIQTFSNVVCVLGCERLGRGKSFPHGAGVKTCPEELSGVDEAGQPSGIEICSR